LNDLNEEVTILVRISLTLEDDGTFFFDFVMPKFISEHLDFPEEGGYNASSTLTGEAFMHG